MTFWLHNSILWFTGTKSTLLLSTRCTFSLCTELSNLFVTDAATRFGSPTSLQKAQQGTTCKSLKYSHEKKATMNYLNGNLLSPSALFRCLLPYRKRPEDVFVQNRLDQHDPAAIENIYSEPQVCQIIQL